MAYGQAQLLFRVKRFFAVGVHFSAHFFKPKFEGTGKARVVQIHVAPELRGLVPLGRAELWAALTFGYFRHMIEAPHWETRLQESDWYHGFSFGWGFGAHYYVLPAVALGGALWFHKPAITRHCHTSGLGFRSCERVDLAYQQWVGFTWSLGATLTFWWGR